MAVSFVALLLIPVNFDYWVFAILIFLNGLGGGIFTAPNTAAIMSQRPAVRARCRLGRARDVLQRRLVAVDRHLLLADDRRAGQHAARRAEQRPAGARACRRRSRNEVANLPPVGSLFAAFLGYNPIAELLEPFDALRAARASTPRC